MFIPTTLGVLVLLSVILALVPCPLAAHRAPVAVVSAESSTRGSPGA